MGKPPKKPTPPTAAEKRLGAARAAKVEAQARSADAYAKRQELMLARQLAKHPNLPETPGTQLHPTDAALAIALGMGKAYLSRLRRRDWFPAKGANGWDESLVREYIHDNLPTAVQLIGPRLTQPGTPKAKEHDDSTQEALRVLRSSTDPCELARAGSMIQARKLASSFESGDIDSRAINGLKSALAEWRNAESDQIDLAKKRGQLVPRATVEIVAATLAGYLLRAQEAAENMLATQVERWLDGNGLADLSAEDRQLEVARWARRRSRELREAVASGLESVVANALSEVGE